MNDNYTTDTVCPAWLTSPPPPPAWMTPGWPGSGRRTPCGVSNSHHQVLGGHRLVLNITFLRSLYDCVPARNIAPPLLKLVISPSPSNRVKGRGAYLYPGLPPISVFLSCISKIPNLCQTALPQSDSSLTFQLSALPYLHAVPLTIWVLLCTIFSTYMFSS